MPQTASLRACSQRSIHALGCSLRLLHSAGAVWREAWLWWTLFSCALDCCALRLSGCCLHTLYPDFVDADWTPRERPSWRIRIRWRSIGRRSSRLVALIFVLLFCSCSCHVSFLDSQHLSDGLHVFTSASSSHPWSMIASYKACCSSLATFLLQFSFQRYLSPSYYSHSLPSSQLSTTQTTYTPPLYPPPRTCPH